MIPKFPRILNWINKQRVAAGKQKITEIPNGYRYSSIGCPIAQGLGDASVGIPHWHFKNERFNRTEPMPKYVTEFITKFDCGDHPELVQNAVVE